MSQCNSILSRPTVVCRWKSRGPTGCLFRAVHVLHYDVSSSVGCVAPCRESRNADAVTCVSVYPNQAKRAIYQRRMSPSLFLYSY